MAEVAVDERRLLKTMRWYDGVVIGLANPGFLLVGLAFSIVYLGGKWALALWIISAIIGALQAYIYCEPAAMFPDKPGGLSVYAREGWRKHFSLAGPIAVFGYWFAWSSVLAVYGSFIGLLLIGEFADAESSLATWTYDPVGLSAISWAKIIGIGAIILCYVFNVRGMRPAVGLSYVVAAMMVIPIVVIAFGALLTGDVGNHAVGSNYVAASVEFFGDTPSAFNQFALIMVWLYILGWSTYGPEAAATFAPEYKDTKNDTRKALAVTGGMNVVLACLLPIAVLGTVGYDVIVGDLSGVVYLIDVMHTIAGDTLGTLLTLCLCAGLLLSMNTATMDGSRALYALSEEGMTIKQLGVLNKHHVPARAMTLDAILNIALILVFPGIFFILAAGNLGYMLSHVLALSGVLLLRRDRPNWPRPIKLAPIWMVLAGVFCALNALFIIFGVVFLKYTGYAFDPADTEFTNPTAWVPRIIIVGALALAAGIIGYVVAQHQHGKRFRWRDPSDEQPTQEALDSAAPTAPATA
jgi:amino acid transporter